MGQINVLQYIEQTNGAKTPEEAFDYFALALGSMGFDLILMSLMNDHASIGKAAGHGIIRNYGDDWMKYYSEKGYADVDPVRKQVMLTTHPFLWDKLNTYGAYSDKAREMMFEAKDAGLMPQWNGMEYDQYDNLSSVYLVWRDEDSIVRGTCRLAPTDRCSSSYASPYERRISLLGV